jgi:hypothetical protein
VRPFSQQAFAGFRVEAARAPRSRRGRVAVPGRTRRVRRALVRAAVLVALTGVLLLALATPVIAGIG